MTLNMCTESRAIVRYIAQKFASQGTPLLGETLEEQAIINQWVEVESHNLNEPFKPELRLMAIKPEPITSRKHVRHGMKSLALAQGSGRWWKKMQNGFLVDYGPFLTEAQKRL